MDPILRLFSYGIINHMFRERHLLEGGRMIEAIVRDDGGWSLRYGRPGDWQVAYEDGGPYAFKSVEQLRYDFERDVRNAIPQG